MKGSIFSFLFLKEGKPNPKDLATGKRDDREERKNNKDKDNDSDKHNKKPKKSHDK
jgi:hypothetical protein